MSEIPKGVTVNGIPLDSYLGKIKDKKIESEVMAIVRASKNQHLYHAIKTRCKKRKEERNGPVMTISNIEIHQKNKDNYIQQMGRHRDVKGMMVAILLSSPKQLSLFEMKQEFELRSDGFHPKAAQLRVHMGYLMKSELGSFITKDFTEGRQRGAKYIMSNEGKNRFNLETAVTAANNIKKRVVDQNLKSIKKQPTPGGDKIQKTQDDIAFKYFDEESETPTKETKIIPPRIRLEGEVHFHFHFHIER